jgi:hypothetical protein
LLIRIKIAFDCWKEVFKKWFDKGCSWDEFVVVVVGWFWWRKVRALLLLESTIGDETKDGVDDECGIRVIGWVGGELGFGENSVSLYIDCFRSLLFGCR